MAGAGVLRIEQVLDRIVDLRHVVGRNCCIWAVLMRKRGGRTSMKLMPLGRAPR